MQILKFERALRVSEVCQSTAILIFPVQRCLVTILTSLLVYSPNTLIQEEMMRAKSEENSRRKELMEVLIWINYCIILLACNLGLPLIWANG